MVKVASKILTPREAEVIAWLVQGNTAKTIAWKLSISETTTKSQLGSAKRRLGAKTLPQLAYELGRAAGQAHANTDALIEHAKHNLADVMGLVMAHENVPPWVKP